MPKFKKKGSINKKTKKIFDEKLAYNTVIITAILAMGFLILSFLFNSELISLNFTDNVILEILNILIRVFSVLLFFLFISVSYGNYQELIGKTFGWKLLLVFAILSIIQTIFNAVVFGFAFLGLLFLIIYLFLIQDS